MSNDGCSSCNDSGCSANKRQDGETEDQFRERQEISEKMCKVKHKIIVLSGKGGVGKSTVAVNLAVALANKGAKVGLMDIDFHGPSVPYLLGLEEYKPRARENSVDPVRYAYDKKIIKVMSIGFFLHEGNEPVIWRGPLKMGAIRQFVSEVEWGDLDFLIVDSPPGTGDEPLSACQLIPDIDGAVIVTMPQRISIQDVRKSINFCSQLNLKVIGVVENMSGLVCPKCGEVIDTFTTGGGEKMAKEMNVPFLGRIPIDPAVMVNADKGDPFLNAVPDSPASIAFLKATDPIYSLNK